MNLGWAEMGCAQSVLCLRWQALFQYLRRKGRSSELQVPLDQSCTTFTSVKY